MNHRGINYSRAKETYQKERAKGKFIKSARKFGVEFEIVPNYSDVYNSDDVELLHNETEGIIPDYWGNTHDGSITDGGVEVQTPPMMMKRGEDEIEKFCSDITDLGWITDKSCGIHVHLDAADIKDAPTLLRRLFLLYFVLDYSILAMVPKPRRSNVYCAPLDNTKASKLKRYPNRTYDKGFDIDKIVSTRPTKKDFLEMFYKKKYEDIPDEIRNHYNEARYHGINFHSLGQHGTVEIRYLEGTLDAHTINNWIALHQHIVDSARVMREIDSIELFHVKGPKTRLRKFAEMTSMPDYILEFACSRIDEFKN